MNSHFALDRSHGKLMGVCSGLARSTGIDPLGIRLLAVIGTLTLLGPLGPILYLVTAMVAPND